MWHPAFPPASHFASALPVPLISRSPCDPVIDPGRAVLSSTYEHGFTDATRSRSHTHFQFLKRPEPTRVRTGARKGGDRHCVPNREAIQFLGPRYTDMEIHKMLKRLAAVAIASFACLAFAQTVTPTYGHGEDQFDHGANSAAVQQNVNLILPPAVGLHLDVTELDFDIGLLGSPEAEFVCVYGHSLEDTDGGVFNNQRQWLPLGTSYGVASDWSST